MSQIGGGGGGWRAGLQSLLQRGQEALAKVRGGDTKAADGKTDVKAGDKAGGAAGAKGKGKAKGKDGVERLIAGSDEFSVEDDERERRRKQQFFLGNDSAPRDFVPQDSTQERSSTKHISAEFRGQVASGLTQGRSFTQGSCLVPDTLANTNDDLDDKPKKNKRR